MSAIYIVLLIVSIIITIISLVLCAQAIRQHVGWINARKRFFRDAQK